MKNALIIACLFISTIATATDYYVSSTGNDANNGLSSSAPWKTIAKVNASTFSPGDKILFNRGDVWRETIIVPSSGDINFPIVFSSYGSGAIPIIDGSDIASIWTKDTGMANVYYSILSASTNQVFRDDLRATRGISKAALNDHEWFCDGTTLYYRDDSGTPQGGEYIITASVRENNIELANNWVGKDYITVSGLKVTKANGDAIVWPGAVIKTIITNCEITYAFQNGLRSIAGNIASDILVTLNNISWNGACGVSVITPSHDWEISYNNVFRNCQYADDIGSHDYNAGIHTWCEDGTVLRIRIIHNNVYSNGKLFGDIFITGVRGIGIHMDSPTATSYADGNFIAYNKVYDNNNKGINLERTTYQTVAYNLVYNNIGADGIAFTQWSTDNPSAHNRVYNNVSYGNLIGIIILGASEQTANVCIDNEVKNNICIGNTIQQFDALYGGENDGTIGKGNIYTNNCFGVFGAGTAYWGYGHPTTSYADLETKYGSPMYNVQADPMFVDAANGDFHLKAGSPAIDVGVEVGITSDYDGNPILGLPDIGAYEFGSVSPSPVVPGYQSSIIQDITPSILEITYDVNLSNIVPVSSAFTVVVNSATRTINSITISGSKVQLTLSSPVVYGNIVSVAYTKPGTNSLQTPSGGQAASFASQTVTNNVAPPVSPIYVSSAIANVTPALMELVYSLSLANIIPVTSAFTVKVNSVIRTVSSVTISGSKVQLILSSPVVYGDILTVDYTKPSTNPLQTTAGGQAASFIAQTVTNNVASLTIPAYVSSSIENATPSLLVVTYNMSLANLVPSASAFSVNVNSVLRTVNAVAVSGTKVQLTMASPVTYGDIVTFSYTKPASNPLQTTAGGQAASFIAQTVTNNVASLTIPAYVSSSIENPTPSVLIMNYNMALANIIPATSNFSVLVNSVVRRVSTITISGTKVQLTLSSKIVSGDVVTISYIKPTVNPLQSASGTIASSLTSQPVVNNCINVAPTVVITSPINNSSFPAIANIAISVNATDADGSISMVEFYNGSIKIGSASSAPYTFTWNNVSAGTYSLTAIAIDNLKAKTISSSISVSVNNETTSENQPPVIKISNPQKGNIFENPATIIIDAVASDPDGTINKVEFYSGAIKLFEVTSVPYTYTWKDVKAGTYSITAIATDNLNATTTSLPIEFKVGANIKYDANSEIVNLYPNPNDGHFSIEFINPLQNEKSELVITDLTGKQVYNGLVSKEEAIKQIDLTNVKSGIYILIILDKGIFVTKKIIIN